MQQQIHFRIFSKSSYKSKTQQSEFATATYKLRNPKQDLNSIVYLSSIIQTQNQLLNNFNPTHTNYSERKPKVGAQTPNKGIENIQDEIQLPKARKTSKIYQFMQTQRKEFKTFNNGLGNIIGQFIPGSNSKAKQSEIEQNLQRARTFTTMPLNKCESSSISKKIKNQIRLKQEFGQFITGFKKKNSSIKLNSKIATQPRQTYQNNTVQRYKDRHSQAQTVDLYNFLKKPAISSKMRKTEQLKVQYPMLSKRMAEIMLRNQLGAKGSHFNLAKLGNRRSFKMKINAQ